MAASNRNNDKKQLDAKEWRERAIRLRRQGFTIREIASKVERSASVVHDALDAARKAVPVEDVEALREQQADEIRTLKRKWRDAAHTGDKDAADVYLKACAREAKLLGLDAPIKTELSGEVKTTTAHDELLARLARLAAAAATVRGDSEPEPGRG